jgi:UDP-N-acetylglucosamine:LPS N-acetylglucosamine transferase
MLIRRLPGSTDFLSTRDDIIIKNHLRAKDLEAAINESEYVISRSGYTTVMDVCKLQKKSILIPTPGQTEQEYLAAHLQKQGWCMAVSQDKFRLGQCLEKAKNFKYQLPDLHMDTYKQVVIDFITSLSNSSDK